MATLQSAQLTITINQTLKTAKVLIKGDILFTPNDVGSFDLECSVFGDDPIADDFLFRYQSRGLGAQGFTIVEPFEFSSTESLSILNEDIIGKDEIYAEIVLKKKDALGPVVSKLKTNV